MDASAVTACWTGCKSWKKENLQIDVKNSFGFGFLLLEAPSASCRKGVMAASCFTFSWSSWGSKFSYAVIHNAVLLNTYVSTLQVFGEHLESRASILVRVFVYASYREVSEPSRYPAPTCRMWQGQYLLLILINGMLYRYTATCNQHCPSFRAWQKVKFKPELLLQFSFDFGSHRSLFTRHVSLVWFVREKKLSSYNAHLTVGEARRCACCFRCLLKLRNWHVCCKNRGKKVHVWHSVTIRFKSA